MSGLLIGFVILVTTIFSFVGTISCCVLIGMMMGSLRDSRGTAIPVSLIFPMVTIALLQYPAPAVSLQKATSLAALCFAVFWAMYWLTRGLMLLESTGKPSSRRTTRSSASQAAEATSGVHERHAGGISGTPGLADAVQGRDGNQDVALTKLQGKWVSLTSRGQENSYEEVLEFNQETFQLEWTDARGRFQAGWAGSVRCGTMGPFNTITMFNVTSHASVGAAPPWDGEQTWIYRLNTGTLFIASQFGEGSSQEPAIGLYRKADD